MFMSKSERKRGSTCMALIIGALAVIGAAGIVNKGKKLVSGTCCKLKSMMNKEE